MIIKVEDRLTETAFLLVRIKKKNIERHDCKDKKKTEKKPFISKKNWHIYSE